MENNNTNNQVPSIPESEMKLPEEQFGEAAPAAEPKTSSAWTIALFLLLVVLLAALAVVVIWGEELIDMVLPAETVEITPMPETPNNDAAAAAPIENIEAELNEIDFTEMESELDAIEAEIEAGATATSTS